VYDLVLGYVIVALASCAACFVGGVFARRWRGLLRTTVAAVLVVLTVAFAAKVQGRLIMARFLPFSNVILVGNWTTLGAACLAGMLLTWRPIPFWRRAILGLALLGVGAHALTRQMPGDTPPATDTWSDGVCLQSNRASCSACSAATLLTCFDIPANEQEMMELCLTGANGTPTLGLFRGLKLKTSDNSYRVEPFFSDIEELLADDDWPALLLVKLEIGAKVDPRYEQQWGWTPGLGHAVVVFGRVGPGRIEVGDPSVGREHWTIDDLCILWQGEGLRLRPK
jgi:hypothetical protein